MMALRHTNELKIPEKVLTLCSKSDPIEIRLVRSMIWQVIWEIPTNPFKPQRGSEGHRGKLKWEIPV